MNSPSVDAELFNQINETETRFEIHEPLVKAFVPEEGRFEAAFCRAVAFVEE